MPFRPAAMARTTPSPSPSSSAPPSSPERHPRRRWLGVAAVLVLLATATIFGKSSHVPRDGAPDQAAADVIHVARNQIGDHYAWGGNGPDRWDCSGLTRLWESVGGAQSMPRTADAQQRWAVPIPRAQLLKGDLVFFGDPADHVGIYTGQGRILDASKSGGFVRERALWSTGVIRYGRVPRRGMPRVRPWTLPATAPRPAAAPDNGALAPLAGLPGGQAAPSSRTAERAVAAARSVRGRSGWSDVALVRVAWRHAGGGTLPASRAEIVSRARPVRMSDARIGDLVVYGAPVPHLGLYAGHGYMVDASTTYDAVLVRRVYDSRTVRLARLG